VIRRSIHWQDVVVAAACAAVLSGLPSTLLAWWTGADPLEATRAAGTMLIPADSGDVALFWAAALVHVSVTLFWAVLLALALPRKRLVAWALLAAAVIAVLDLRVIARLFPEVYALSFWPQFADHLAWGAAFGGALSWRLRTRERRA
jgi:hypothetical protein